MKKKILCVCMALLLIGSIGCGKKEPAPQKKPSPTTTTTAETQTPKRKNGVITLTLGFSTNTSDPRAIASNFFKEQVEKESKGSIKVNIFPDSSLGGDAQLISSVVSGDVDMTVSSAGNFSRYVPRSGASALPYLFTDFDSAWKFMDSPLMEEVAQEFLNYDIHILSYFDNGFRCVTTSEKFGPVNTADDMKGLNIRTPENDTVMETISALGANPKMLAFSEVYDALNTGQFDAQENPIPVIYNNKLYEVQSYLAITNHSYDAMPFVLNEKVWQEMTPEEQQIVQKAATEAANLNRSLVKEQTDAYISLLQEAGMTITYPDLKLFQEKTSGVMDYFSTAYGDKFIEALSELVTD